MILLIYLALLTAMTTINLKKRNFSKKIIVPSLFYLIIFSLISLLFIIFNYSFLSHDSWVLTIGGKYLALSHEIPDYFLGMAGLFSYIIHSASSFFGFDYIYALYPLITASFFIFFLYNLYSPQGEKKPGLNREFFLCLLLVLFLLTTFFILFNANYLHSNLLYAVYSFIALTGLWMRVVNRKRSWLIISSLALLTSSFLRMEGPLFSLIIIIILLSLKTISFKEKLFYSGIAVLPVIVWNIRLFFILPAQTDEHFLSPPRVLLVAVLYSLALAALLFNPRGFLRKLKQYYPLSMLYFLSLGWSVLIFVKGLEEEDYLLVLKRYGILLNNVLKNGGWGISWTAIAALFVLSLFFKGFKHESVFLYYIFSFFLLYNSIHLFRGGWRLNWGDSGNRMLLHIIFLLSFYAFLKLKWALFPLSLKE
jgi:hypothetical protein